MRTLSILVVLQILTLSMLGQGGRISGRVEEAGGKKMDAVSVALI